ncbi:MAG: hypothetical protein IJT60_03890, partial [Clostridia bacterium]|nr:hypothetical protein [Clostridia bacterium]
SAVNCNGFFEYATIEQDLYAVSRKTFHTADPPFLFMCIYVYAGIAQVSYKLTNTGKQKKLYILLYNII